MKWSLILNGVNVLLKPERSLCFPAHIQIEPINDCNLRCVSCSRAKMVDAPQKMNLEHFKTIIDTIRPVYITLSGLGETLMHPDIAGMVAYCSAAGIYVNLTTNGTLLDAHHAGRLLDARLHELSVSFDAANRETYRSIRCADLWDQLVANVSAFIELRNRRKQTTPLVRAQIVLQKKNIHELSDFVRLCRTIPVDSIYAQHLSLNGVEERAGALVGDMTKAEMLAALRDAHACARDLGIRRTNFAEVIRKIDFFWEQYQMHECIEKKACMNPWFDAYINVDGRLQPCCAFAGDISGIYFGNVFSGPFKALYNNPDYRSFRKRIRKGQRPFMVCRRCYPVGMSDILEQLFIPR